MSNHEKKAQQNTGSCPCGPECPCGPDCDCGPDCNCAKGCGCGCSKKKG